MVMKNELAVPCFQMENNMGVYETDEWPNIITTKEASLILFASSEKKYQQRTVRLARGNKIPNFKQGSRFYYSKNALLRFVDNPNGEHGQGSSRGQGLSNGSIEKIHASES